MTLAILFFGQCYIVKCNYLAEELIRCKRAIKSFLIDHYAGEIENKNGKTPPTYRRIRITT